MSKRVLLLHGWGGSDFPHWQSWLAGEIAKEYGCVNFLRLSDFERPKLELWLEELRAALRDFQPDIVVTHSLANTLWFHLCSRETLESIEKLYLVAPPSLECSIEALGEFFPLEVPKNLYAKEAILISSTNDPYMTLEEAKKLQEDLQIKMELLEDAGHINAESGYGEWPWILQEIREAASL